MRLYNSRVSGNCYKVRLLLAHLGTPCELVEISVVDRENRPAEFLAKAFQHRVPLLELDDGRAIGESNAILCYLAEGTPWLPDDRFERAGVLAWMFFEQNLHEPNIAVVRYWITILGAPEELRERIRTRQAAGMKALDVMERQLAKTPFLAGDAPTVADIALYGYTHVAGEGDFDLRLYPSISAWLGRVASLPGHEPMRAT